MIAEEVTEKIIAAAMEVHRELGPGLLESAYEQCFCHELHLRGLQFRHRVNLPALYKGTRLDCGNWIDLIINELVVIELKAVEQLLPIYEAQLMTCLHLTKLRVDPLINFNVSLLKDGIKRRVI